jgi:hypothetical protein
MLGEEGTHLGAERALDEVAEGHRADERAQAGALAALLSGLRRRRGPSGKHEAVSSGLAASKHTPGFLKMRGTRTRVRTSSANTFMDVVLGVGGFREGGGRVG